VSVLAMKPKKKRSESDQSARTYKRREKTKEEDALAINGIIHS